MKSFLEWLGKHKVSTHTIGVLVTGLILYYRNNADFHALVVSVVSHIPKWVTTLALAAAWLYAFYRNPQKQPGGSAPLSIIGGIKGAALTLLIFCCLIPAQAQQPNDGIHVDLSAAWTSVTSAPSVSGSGTATATVMTLRAPVTDRLAARLENITLPKSQATVTLGELEYRRNVSDILKSKNLRFDASKFQLFAYGGFGGKREDSSTSPAFSAIAGGGLDRILAGNIALRLFDIAYLRSSLHQGVFLTNNELTVASGLSIRF